MAFQIWGTALLAVFYGCYFGKLLCQRSQGIRTDQLGRGKAGRARRIEQIMKLATVAVPVAEEISILGNVHGGPTWLRMAGVVLALLGDGVFIASVATMRDSWRAGVAAEDDTELVTGGIYRFSRNPAFLGFDLVYAGLALMFFSVPLLALSAFAAGMFHMQIVCVEEPFLQQKFGEEYDAYRRKVCRYIGRK